MKDWPLLFSTGIALGVHAAFLLLNLSVTPPILASQPTAIEVTLVGPPEPAAGAASESAEPEQQPTPMEEPQEAEQLVKIQPEPKPEPLPEPVPEPKIDPIVEPEPVPVVEIPDIVPEEPQETVVVEETVQIEPFAVEEGSTDTAVITATETGSTEPSQSTESASSGDRQQASAEQQYSVHTVDRMPGYAYNPKPPYPRAARRHGQEGTVLLVVEVLRSGRVGNVEVEQSSGHELLDDAATKAVRKWRFVPAKRGLSPVRVKVRIPVEFSLKD